MSIPSNYSHQTVAMIEFLRTSVSELDDAYSAQAWAETYIDRAEAMDDAVAALFSLLGECLSLVERLKTEGAEIDDLPQTEAAWTVFTANFPKLVTDIEKKADEAIETVEMVEKRLKDV